MGHVTTAKEFIDHVHNTRRRRSETGPSDDAPGVLNKASPEYRGRQSDHCKLFAEVPARVGTHVSSVRVVHLKDVDELPILDDCRGDGGESAYAGERVFDLLLVGLNDQR
eukprot:6546097-Prymnesium_polylepis.1